MKFWDSSAVIPLLVAEETSPTVSRIAAGDRQMHVWWATEIECISTLARLERQHIDPDVIEAGLGRLAAIREDWNEIAPGDAVRDAARRFMRVHPLRAADALQLAAAWILADGDSASVEIVCLDQRLRDAARREGFQLLP